MEPKVFENFDLKAELAKKGTKQYGYVRVAHRPNGAWITLPIMIAVGEKDGPTVLATGCNHGDEYEGPEAIAAAFHQLDTATMAGSFVGVPAVNSEAFAEGKRYNTIDFVPADMNRIYPGSPKGPFTHYLTHFYVENVMKHMDAVITIHGGGNCEYLVPLVLYTGEDTPLGRTTKEMAEAFGFKVLWKNDRYDPKSGIEDEYAYSLGIPAITPEVGGQSARHGGTREENVKNTTQGIVNVLTYFKVLPGAVPKNEGVRYFDFDYIFARHGGVIKPQKTELDAVKEGEVMARIYDIFGNEIDNVTAPYDAFVLGYWSYSICQPRDWLYIIGREVDPKDA